MHCTFTAHRSDRCWCSTSDSIRQAVRRLESRRTSWFAQSFRVSAGTVPSISHDRFLPHSSPFIKHNYQSDHSNVTMSWWLTMCRKVTQPAVCINIDFRQRHWGEGRWKESTQDCVRSSGLLLILWTVLTDNKLHWVLELANADNCTGSYMIVQDYHIYVTSVHSISQPIGALLPVNVKGQDP